MKKLSWLALLGLLAGCNDGGSPSGAYGRPTDMRPDRNPFVNAAKNSNSNLTTMIATNAAQVNEYISARMVGYTGTTTPDKYVAVAEMALDLATMNVDEIETAFNDTPDILAQAMYVLNHALAATCAGDSGAAVASCINLWRNENVGAVNSAVNMLRANGELLNIADVEFAAPDAKLKFSVNPDTGEINGISVIGTDGQTQFTRNGIDFINDTSVLTYDSGTGEDLILSYSDFGMYTIENNADAAKIAYAPFAGGYAAKQIDVAKIETDMSFSGRAVGTATKGDDSINLAGTAILNFTTGDSPVSELTAIFNNWYNVNITQTGATSDAQFVFTGTPTKTDVILTNTTGTGTMNIGYYGPDGTPTEATGLAQFTESGVENGVKFDMAFGVNKK